MLVAVLEPVFHLVDDDDDNHDEVCVLEKIVAWEEEGVSRNVIEQNK